MRRWCRLGQSTHLMDCFKGNKKSGHPHISWEFQDPKMEVLYHIRPYFLGIFSYMPYIGLTYGRHLQFRFLKFPLTIFHWTIPSVFRFSRKIPSIFLHRRSETWWSLKRLRKPATSSRWRKRTCRPAGQALSYPRDDARFATETTILGFYPLVN